jgi:murein DD-endopeptidase MepM/ murein hydrolase activator NlpD
VSFWLAASLLAAAPPPAEYRDPGCEVALCAAPIPRPDLSRETPISLEHRQGALWRGQVEIGSRVALDGSAVPVAEDGAFLIGFDRDQAATAQLTIIPAGKTPRQLQLSIAPRQWRVQRVNVARNLPREGEESWARREAEVLRMQAARARGSDAPGWRQDFIWPARGRISGRFGAQRIYRGEPGSYHGGVDVAAATGTPVVAPADGVVVLAAPGFSMEGNLVILDHGFGLSSAFLHLSRIDVREGQAVRQGETLGAVGATGRAAGAHLHWALTWNGAKLDPERVVPAME